MTTVEMIEARNKIVAEQRKTLNAAKEAGRAMTADEKTGYEAREKDFDRYTEAIEAEQKQAEHEKTLDALQPDKGIIAAPGTRDGSAALDAAKKRAAFSHFLRDGLSSLAKEERDGMTAGSDPAGGYLVAPLEIVQGILAGVDAIFAFREICDNKKLTNGAALGQATLDDDLSDCDWTTEIQTAPIDAGLTFGRREMKTNPVRKLVKISNKLLRLADPTAEITQRLAYKIAKAQETAYMTGDGAGKPLGIFTADADGITTARDLQVGAISAFDYTALLDMIFGIEDAYLANASFVMNREILKLVREMTDGDGRYLWVAGNTPTARDTILGYPVIKSTAAPKVTTSGNYIAVFGDFKYYRTVDALDMKVTRLNELYQASAQVGFIGEYEGDGQPLKAEAFIRAKITA